MPVAAVRAVFLPSCRECLLTGTWFWSVDDTVTISKGREDTLLERLVDLGVLPYCRTTYGSGGSKFTIPSVLDALKDNNELVNCDSFLLPSVFVSL